MAQRVKKDTVLPHRCLKSPCKKGIEKIPTRPFHLKGRLPNLLHSRSNWRSMKKAPQTKINRPRVTVKANLIRLRSAASVVSSGLPLGLDGGKRR